MKYVTFVLAFVALSALTCVTKADSLLAPITLGTRTMTGVGTGSGNLFRTSSGVLAVQLSGNTKTLSYSFVPGLDLSGFDRFTFDSNLFDVGGVGDGLDVTISGTGIGPQSFNVNDGGDMIFDLGSLFPNNVTTLSFTFAADAGEKFVFSSSGLRAVPEPASMGVVGLAMGAAGLFGWRRRKLAAKKE
jgi:PEP-CTERM motif